MSDGECSRPKRLRSESIDLPIDFKEEIISDDESDNGFFPDDGDYYEDAGEWDEDDKVLAFPVVVKKEKCSVKIGQVDTSESSPDSSQQSASGPPSTWSTACELKNIPFKKQNGFFGNPGGEPIDFFNFFFEEESLLLFICEQTNAQAAKLLMEDSMERSRIKLWKDLTIPELRIFLGLLFHMGTMSLSRVQDYWKTDRLFAIPIFRKQMARNRFQLIMKCLYFTSEAGSFEDPLFKIRHIIDYFNKKMEVCYYPAKELSLEESIIFWEERLRFQHNILNKRRNGIKLYMLTEHDGLIQKLYVHARGQEDRAIPRKGHVERVVMQLLENKLHNGHSIYMDNYYNSVGLAKKLLDKQTYCTGILSKDLKDNPVEISNKILKDGENMALCKDGVIVGKWKDKHPVMYVSTEFQSEMTPVTNMKGQSTYKPTPIAKYNEFHSGVYRQCQLLAFYPCERITLRWDLKLAIHTFQLLFVNSYKIYKKVHPKKKKMTFYDYRLSVINQLLPENTSASVAGPSRQPVHSGVHIIAKVTEKNLKGNLKRKMCRQCFKTTKKRKDTIFHCEICEDKPGLCFECFDIYHNNIE